MSMFPALKPGLGYLGVNVVFSCCELGTVVYLAGEVPGDKPAVGVVHCLAERVALGGLGAEIHIPK